MEFNWKKIILIIIIIVLVAAVILYIVQSKTKDKVYEEYEPEEEISEEQERQTMVSLYFINKTKSIGCFEIFLFSLF